MKPDRSGEQADEGTYTQSRAYFCPICYQAFENRDLLEKHMKTHRELEVSTTSCKMLARPAGVV
ncbi:MAG: C2H2-type zinc finger protein [Nitrososphaerota archaeon]|nr:C2H2-type zinc finger protein [Nitrososphaerota archaeon]